ncbi:hypothetical protein LXL04_017650 [Taraxacum kok-saghyz]
MSWLQLPPIVSFPPVFFHRLLFPSILLFSLPSRTRSIVHRFYFCWFPPPTCSSVELYRADTGVVCRCTLRETNQETHKPLQYSKTKNHDSGQRYLQRTVNPSVESRRQNICVKMANMLRCQRIGCNATFTDDDNPQHFFHFLLKMKILIMVQDPFTEKPATLAKTYSLSVTTKITTFSSYPLLPSLQLQKITIKLYRAELVFRVSFYQSSAHSTINQLYSFLINL